jgi:hypothetical protein
VASQSREEETGTETESRDEETGTEADSTHEAGTGTEMAPPKRLRTRGEARVPRERDEPTTEDGKILIKPNKTE